MCVNIVLTQATTDIQRFTLSALRYFGVWGNTIFFVCTAWFLVDSKKWNGKKLLRLWLEVWVISVLILILVRIDGLAQIDGHTLLACLMPISFGNNWYISCYLIFYLIYPALNLIIAKLNRRQMLTACLTMLLFYFARFILHPTTDPYFINDLVSWTILYFWVAFIKKYLSKIISSKKTGVLLFLTGFSGFVLLIAATNMLGLRVETFSDHLQRWNGSHNLFIILAVIGMVILANNSNFYSKTINYLSSISLLIYITHENILLRKYYRPILFQWLYSAYGYEHILLWVLAFAAAIFMVFSIISALLDKSLGKAISIFTERIYPKMDHAVPKLITRIEKALSNWE